MTTKREFFDRAVKELSLDTRDSFTLLFANACAMADLIDELRAQLAVRPEGRGMQRIGEAWVARDGAVWEFHADKNCAEQLGLKPVEVYMRRGPQDDSRKEKA